MKIALLDIDGKMPNLALMKISTYHKMQRDSVEWYTPFEEYDILYMAKVFTFTPDYPYVIANAKKIIKGGTGYDIHSKLPFDMERELPDYSIYPNWDKDTAIGFLTRGCPNKCKWCVVPQKEGKIQPYMYWDDIFIEGRTKAVLLDNNVLAHPHGIDQIKMISYLKYQVDFNQGLDARLVTPEIAELLAEVRWIKRIRFGCDTPKQIEECERAIQLINSFGYKGEYFLYCIIMDDLEEAHSRINHWKQPQFYGRVYPHAQPYRDFNDPRQIIPQWQKDLARWTNKKELYKTCSFYDYEPRKGFKCKEYFK